MAGNCWLGVAAGAGVFFITWVVLLLTTPRFDAFAFEQQDGAFDRLLPIYLDIAKFILGLAAGGIVLIVSSSALGANKRLPNAYVPPLILLAMSILYGIIFRPMLVLNFESYRQRTSLYTRWRYIRNRALGYSSLFCFCIGYAWLIWAAAKG